MAALQTIEEIATRQIDLENQIAAIQTQLRSNTAVTNQIRTDTKELLELFHTFTTAMRMGMKFTLTLGKVIRWIAGIISAAVIIYVAYNNLRLGVTLTDVVPTPASPSPPILH